MSIDAKLFLNVHHAQGIGYIFPSKEQLSKGERGSESYQVEVVLPVAPIEGDAIIDGDATWRVKGRWLPINESWVGVQLVDLQVDPNDAMIKHCNGEYRSAWFTEENGSIDDQLKGWSHDAG